METFKKFKLVVNNFPLAFKQLARSQKITVSLALFGIIFGLGNMFFIFLNIIL